MAKSPFALASIRYHNSILPCSIPFIIRPSILLNNLCSLNKYNVYCILILPHSKNNIFCCILSFCRCKTILHHYFLWLEELETVNNFTAYFYMTRICIYQSKIRPAESTCNMISDIKYFCNCMKIISHITHILTKNL